MTIVDLVFAVVTVLSAIGILAIICVSINACEKLIDLLPDRPIWQSQRRKQRMQ
jgi:hypothetical protein